MPALSADDNQWSAVDHAKETARPGYYGIMLDTGIKAELTATTRAGIHRYTFPVGKPQFLHIDLDHSAPKTSWNRRIIQSQLRMVGPRTIEGYRIITGWAKLRRVYFHMELSRDISSFTIKDGDKDYGQVPVANGAALKAKVGFDSSGPEKLVVKVSLSTTSIENARLNMECEAPGWDFDDYASKADKCWDELLGRVEAVGKEHDLQKFYTALYHTMISPYNYQDVDGRYRGMDKQVHRAVPGYQHYSVFSLWDTFRALQPLMSIIRPALAAQWGEVLVKGYEEGGILPKWPIASSYTGCMVGYPAVIVLADLACKDLVKGNIDTWAKAAWQSTIFREDLYKKFQGTRELDLITLHPYYKDKYGYVPADSIAESVSWGMEMAYGDWCTSQLLKAAGDTALASAYMEKAGYYKRYIDPETKLMRGVMGDGSFRTPFNPRYSSHMKSDYTEGNAFQWSFFAPHDMDNFITAIGGKKELETRLDTLFTTSSEIDGAEASADISGLIGQYAHGNEPSHHMAYLYNWTDAPWKGQERLDFILKNFYKPTPDGIIGNEDCGQMSAWYIMSSLGFYQVCPGIPIYTIGRPMVTSAKIKVKNGIFEIIAHNNSAENKYVKEVRLNGKKLDTPFFSHKDIENGGKLEFTMSNTHE